MLKDNDFIENFTVDLDGYEGPLDILLSLAHTQKVDLTQISIMDLADQYLDFIAKMHRINLEIAADYLVMAAWLAYLKSRLLLPKQKDDDTPSGEEMAEALQRQLQRLHAMHKAGEKLMARPQLGQDFFSRELSTSLPKATVSFQATLGELLKSYGQVITRSNPPTLQFDHTDFYTLEDAMERFAPFLSMPQSHWENLLHFLPKAPRSRNLKHSALASTFGACLELAKEGKIKLRQNKTFGEIFLKATHSHNTASGAGS